MDLSYENYIRSIIGQDVEFYNSGPEHARIVLSTIFKEAKKNVKVYCENLLSESVSNSLEYLNAVRSFLTRQTEGEKTLHFLLQEPDENILRQAPIFKLLLEFANKDRCNIALRKMQQDETIMIGQTHVNFTIADGVMYRMETDVVNKKAFGNFKDANSVDVCNGLFERYWNRAVDIELV